MLKTLKINNYRIEQIQMVLNNMHLLLKNNAKDVDYRYVIFPYAFVTNQHDKVVPKWFEIDKEAEKYVIQL